jgi:DNA mismatch repair protein MSH6
LSSFKQIKKGLDHLADLAGSFKSDGIRHLLRAVPDLEAPLNNVYGKFVGDELLPARGVHTGYDTYSDAVLEIEKALDEQLEEAKKRDRAACFKDIGTKDIYQIQLKTKTKVPSNWVKMSSTQAFDRYYSPEVERLVKQLKEARERKHTAVTEFQYTVFAEFDADYPTWMATIKAVAELDCLISLAKASASLGEPAVRPEIVESDHAIIEFEELRHPCVIK